MTHRSLPYLCGKKLRMLWLGQTSEVLPPVKSTLAAAGAEIEFKMTENRYTFLRHLIDFVPHLILADHALKPFTDWQALTLVRRAYPDIPFIVVAGKKEAAAITQLIMAGATGVVWKSHLDLLPGTLDRALGLHHQNSTQLTTMRLLRQIENNIAELKQLQAFMSGGEAHPETFPGQVLSEIGQSLDYLLRLKASLRAKQLS
jgi:DNA-binding NarL/FixJ family response regulator